MSLAELRERVAKATGPDREIDARLYLHISDARNLFEADDGAGVRYRDFERQRRYISWDRIPHYSRSLDKTIFAVETVFPDCGWRIEDGFGNYQGEPFPPRAQIAVPHEGEFGNTYLTRGDGTAPTPALALIAALLEALAGSGEK